jgi:hypothetical protein
LKKLDLSQTIGILANIGVIAGIVFLAMELRQNNSLLAAQASYTQFSVERERRTRTMENQANLTDIARRARAGEELTPTESLQLQAHNRDTLEAWQWQFRENQAGRLETRFMNIEDWRALWEFNSGIRERYDETLNRRTPEFIQFMEENVINER